MLAVLFLLSAIEGQACDVCGGASVDFRNGVLPDYRRSILSLSGQWNAFTTQHPPLFDWDQAYSTRTEFRQVSLDGRFFVADKWMLQFNLPFTSVRHRELGFTETFTQWGDASLGASYTFHWVGQKSGSENQILSGINLKLPTSVWFAHNEPGSLIPPSLRFGSSSYDLVFNTTYLRRVRAYAAQAQVIVRRNHVQEDAYRAGDRFTASLGVMRFFPLGETQISSFIPALTVVYSRAAQDWANVHLREVNQDSGGQIISGQLSLSVFSKHFGGQISAALPIIDHQAGGQIRSNGQLQAAVHYLF